LDALRSLALKSPESGATGLITTGFGGQFTRVSSTLTVGALCWITLVLVDVGELCEVSAEPKASESVGVTAEVFDFVVFGFAVFGFSVLGFADLSASDPMSDVCE
jgi:hypothetical protein